MGAKNIKSREVFEAELKAGGGVFALFYSSWCPFCTAFLPAYDGHAKKAGGAFVKVSLDDLPELEDRFSIEVVPSVLYFKGGKLSGRLDGALGRGLSAEGLAAFAGDCLAKGKGN